MSSRKLNNIYLNGCVNDWTNTVDAGTAIR